MMYPIQARTYCKHLKKLTKKSISDLGQQGSHLQSQLLVHREVSRGDGLIRLISQQQPLPIGLPPDLEREIQPMDGERGRTKVKKRWR